MRWVTAILEAVLRVLLPALVEASKPKAEDARPQPVLRDRLRQRVWDTWGRKTACIFLPIVWLLSGGCATRTIYVPDGTPVRLRETVPRAKVWVLDASGTPVAGVMDLPEGWYCLPVPEDP